jgi:BirA family biotin operon repressor/biotin-[acetyl-CoA-carboxylase] ligase
MTAHLAHPRTWQVLNALADGKFHSGEMLAQQLGVSRASVFNALTEVADYGIALHRIRGRGYRLAHPWQQLDMREVTRYLGQDAQRFSLDAMQQAASSNSVLLQRIPLGAPSGSVLAVELQTAGRGRMGRVWHSGLGDALTFSLLWRFEKGLNDLSGLSLAVGVAIIRALRGLGIDMAQLKWPNDVLASNGKLAGVLLEAQGDMLGPSAVVIGVGMNYRMPTQNSAKVIAQPVSALDELCDELPSRNRLLANLLLALADVLDEFAQNGFGGLHAEWQQYHAHQDKPIVLQQMDGRTISGIACGVNERGEIVLKTAQGVQYFNAGEVTGQRT